MERVNWNKYEEALLIEAYLKIHDVSDSDQFANAWKEITEKLSSDLRQYAERLGLEITEKYRNTTGISMKLQNIRFLYTDGREGLSNFSQLDSDMVWMEKVNAVKFNDILCKAKKLIFCEPDDMEMCRTKNFEKKSEDINNQFYLEDFGSGFNTYSCEENDKNCALNLSLKINDKDERYLFKNNSEYGKGVDFTSIMQTEDNRDFLNARKREKCKNEQAETENNGSDALYRKYNIDINLIDDISIEKVDFSLRTLNVLRRSNIHTIYDLLFIDSMALENLRGFGKRCREEIENNLRTICNLKKEKNESEDPIFFIRRERELVARGDFLLLLSLSNNISYIQSVKKYEEAFNTLGPECTKAVVNSKEASCYLYKTARMLQEFAEKGKIIKEILKRSPAPPDRLKKCAWPFIEAFTSDYAKREILKNEAYKDENSKLEEIDLDYKNDYKLLEAFLKWCAFDIQKDINGFLETKYMLEEKTKGIIQGRSSGCTLQELGTTYSLTRERIRQIEKKVIAKFNRWNQTSRILNKICALRNNDRVLTPTELSEFFKADTALFLYLYRNSENSEYYYDSQLDVFIIYDNDTMIEKTQKYLETLPCFFDEKQMNQVIRDCAQLGLNQEYVLRSIESEYIHTGNTYHRDRLHLSDVYIRTLKKYYPKGLHIYDGQCLEEFIEHVKEDYGELHLPEAKHSISARIANVGMLCDRGTYMAKNDQMVSKKLAEKIKTFISDYSGNVIPINMIYSFLENDLIDEGIENKYYLHGIIKELFGNKFILRKDYILKKEGEDSFAYEIINYIKTVNFPVDKEKIKLKFPGTTEIMINMAISDKKIINFFGRYMHANQLDIKREDIDYFDSILMSILVDEQAHHISELETYFERDNSNLLNRLFINNSFSLFSILQYILHDKYAFKRPFVALKGIKINHPMEEIIETILSSDEILISDIMELTREKHVQIKSIMEFLDSLNNTHFIKDKHSLIQIEKTGITPEIFCIVENLISEEITNAVAIGNLACIYNFPKINVEWSEWLIYSLIRKKSTKLDVKSSNYQFNKSTPLISPKGQMDHDVKVAFFNNGIGHVDDLNDIDNLISEYIEDEIEGQYDI